MTLHSFILLFLVCFCSKLEKLAAQSYTESYFQQKTDYNITATLDTVTDHLEIYCELTYTNNAPESLEHIFFHVWWNAFSDRLSAFSNQQLDLGERDFYFADEADLGGYEQLSFTASDRTLEVEPYSEDGQLHKDIVKVILNQPLAPKESRTIIIKSKAKIPYGFSRPGKKDGLYSMTQWYPKPAVYDKEGWHVMPYLAVGEFYSEYGDYNVELLVPENYDAVSTGTVVSNIFREGYKQLILSAKDVPDFAWFTSSSFSRQEKVIKAGGAEIPITLFTDYQDDIPNVMEHMSSALDFYATEVGPYPYPQYTLVLKKSEGGLGMEYPMISIVEINYYEQMLDNLIAHEIGHNWFQSALGSNERKHAWLDEGMNSFYERKYNEQRYPKPNYDWAVPSFLKTKDSEYSLLQSGVCHLHCCGKLKPISYNTTDGKTDLLTYGSNNYERMAFSFSYLEAYLGEDVFAAGVHQYYEKWLHKHPQPADLQNCLESMSGKDLGWFFQDMISDNQRYDFKLTKVVDEGESYKVHVENKGPLLLPFQLTCYDEKESVVHEEWIESQSLSTTVDVPMADYSRVTINGSAPFLDMNRSDNHLRPGRMLFKRGKLGVGLLKAFAPSYSRNISLHPSLSFNQYDGTMVGVGISNTFYPSKRFRWYLQPNYGINSGNLTGLFSIEHDFGIGKDNGLEKWILSLSGRKYAYGMTSIPEGEQELKTYFKVVPGVTLNFDKGILDKSSLEYRLHYINLGAESFSSAEEPKDRTSIIHQLSFKKRQLSGLTEINNLVQLEYESYSNIFDEPNSYLKLSVDHKRKIYYKPEARFEIRFFAGYFLKNTRRNSASYSDAFTRGSFALTQEAYTDHTYEGFYFGRSEQEGGSSRQVLIEEGGFKMPITSAYRFALSNDLIITTNLKLDLPFMTRSKLQLRPFLDAGYLRNKATVGQELEGRFLYAGGLAVELGNVIGIYLPLLHSEDFDIPFAGKSFLSKLSFKLDLSILNLWRLSEDPGLLVR